MIETLVLAAVLALAGWLVRHRWRMIREAWRAARWYERLALCLALAPIPGPMDELLGVLVVRRVLKRTHA